MINLLSKWRLLQVIFADPELSQTAKIVAGVLLDCLNTQTGRCDPSLPVLVERTARKRSAVSEALAELKKGGWLKQQKRRGSSAYQFARLSDAEPVQADGAPDDVRKTGLLDRVDDVRDSGPLNGDEVRDSGRVQVQDSGSLEVRDSGHLNTGTGNREGRLSPSSPSLPEGQAERRSLDQQFDEFWESYPPHGSGRTPAKRQYERIVRARLATHEELLAGAMRYAAHRSGHDQRYTTHARNWLLDQSWKDDPRPDNVVPLGERGSREPLQARGWMKIARDQVCR